MPYYEDKEFGSIVLGSLKYAMAVYHPEIANIGRLADRKECEQRINRLLDDLTETDYATALLALLSATTLMFLGYCGAKEMFRKEVVMDAINRAQASSCSSPSPEPEEPPQEESKKKPQDIPILIINHKPPAEA